MNKHKKENTCFDVYKDKYIVTFIIRCKIEVLMEIIKINTSVILAKIETTL